MIEKLFIKTYGCQMNVYDSSRMKDLLEPFGYQYSDNIDEASVVILNTCHIREKAVEKLYSELGRIKKIKDQKLNQGKSMIIVVAGCVAQAEGDLIFSRASYVDIIVGPQSYHTLPDLIKKVLRLEKRIINLNFIEEAKFDYLPKPNFFGYINYISVQEGCDKFCTFCVVPYTRGAEFSRPLEKIYREVLLAANSGTKEIILLGQNVSSYHGKDFNGVECNLSDLILYIAKIPQIQRIRYITSHPKDITDDLIKAHVDEPKLMPFIHLPVQSGSNKILKAMNRKHTKEYYLDIIKKFKFYKKDVIFSSDFIVGFPEETDEDFEDTLRLVQEVKYIQSYSFKYSPRPGTPAALKTQISDEVKSRRLDVLQKELKLQQYNYNKTCIGTIMPVFFVKNEKSEIIGKTPYMQSVFVRNFQDKYIGNIINVSIDDASITNLYGTII